MRTALQRIEELLPKLSDKEATRVAQLLKVRFALKQMVLAEEDVGFDWLLYGIEAELKRRGLLSGPLRPAIQRVAPNYPRDAAEVRAVLTKGMKLTRAQELVMGTLAAEALAAFLCIPLGPRALLVNIHRTVEAVDAAFPGYSESGLLGMLLPRAS